MVSLTSWKQRVILVCFLALTLFSVIVMTYTLYVLFGTSWAIRSMDFSLTDVTIDKDGSKAIFSLVIDNPSNMQFRITYLRTGVVFDGADLTGVTPIEFRPDKDILPNRDVNLNITLPLTDPDSYSSGLWELRMYATVETPHLGERGMNRLADLEV